MDVDPPHSIDPPLEWRRRGYQAVNAGAEGGSAWPLPSVRDVGRGTVGLAILVVESEGCFRNYNGSEAVQPANQTPWPLSIRGWTIPTVALCLFALGFEAARAQETLAECHGYSGPGGACYSGPGGGLYSGPGGGLYSGPGGGLYSGPGGGLYSGPGGGMYTGPGGGLYTGPGGGLYTGPGGGAYTGPPDDTNQDAYRGPWSPCVTGAMGEQWTQQNCP